MNTTCLAIHAPIARRDLIAVLKYVNRSGRSQKCVEGSFSSGSTEAASKISQASLPAAYRISAVAP